MFAEKEQKNFAASARRLDQAVGPESSPWKKIFMVFSKRTIILVSYQRPKEMTHGRAKSKQFLFEKKNQKTFTTLGRSLVVAPGPDSALKE